MHPDGRHERGWDDGECQICGELMIAVNGRTCWCEYCGFTYCLECGGIFTNEDGEPETPESGSCYCPLIRQGDDVGPGPMAPEGRTRLREIQPPQFIGIPLDEGHGFSRRSRLP